MVQVVPLQMENLHSSFMIEMLIFSENEYSLFGVCQKHVSCISPT